MVKFTIPKSKNESTFESGKNRNLKLETNAQKHMVESDANAATTVQPTIFSAVALANENNSNEHFWRRYRKSLQQNVWCRHLFAGGIAGAVSRTVTAPMDRVKIHTQVHPHKMGMIGCFRHLIQEDGVLSLWRGNGVNVMKIMPESAIKFTAYEKIKRLMRGEGQRSMEMSERFLAGAAAGGIAQTLIYPLEVLKVRLALQLTGQYASLRDAVRKLYQYEGLRSFYRGYVPNILGCVPYGGIEFACYETLKGHYTSNLEPGENPSFLVLTACSSISSTVGQCCVYPMALARTRLQSGLPGNTSMISIFQQILKHEGTRGLYRGLVPNICKVVPAVSINFLVYEYTSRSLGIKMT